MLAMTIVHKIGNLCRALLRPTAPSGAPLPLGADPEWIALTDQSGPDAPNPATLDTETDVEWLHLAKAL